MNVSGTGLSGSQTFTANQAGNATFTVTSNATSANTASTIVARDGSGNFSAGTITATLSGNASSATTATNLSGGSVNATTGTFSGVITTRTPSSYTAITSVFASTAAIVVPEVNVGASAGFVPALGQTTVYSSGYRQHLVIGDYRTASAWGGGMFVGLGGNDSYPTEYFLLNYGGSITHSSGSTFLNSANYNSYAPTLTGGGASGTWSINITGSAGSAGSVDYNNLTNKTGGTGTYTTSGDYRAPIFYDSNNTGYYVDPASSSQFYQVYANDWFRAQGGCGLYFQTYGYGLWSAESGGNSYGNATTYNTGRNGWSGWGIGSRHCFMSTGGDNVGVHDNSRGWIWYWNGSNFEINYGYTYMAGSARSPIFYDSDNTGYYLDPASTSVLNGLTVGGYGVLRSPGTINGNIDSDYGQGFVTFDPVPSGTPPISSPNIRTINVGDNFSRRTQLAYTYDTDRAWFRRRNDGGWGSWYEFAVFGNSASAGSLYGTIYYDGNNTGYYVDPASNSVLNSANVYGAWYFQSNQNTGSGSSPPLQAYSTGNNGAIMSFHKGGYYAINMGLDSDTVFRIGGWSAPANLFQMDMSGNLTMAANVTAYSDERLKKDWSELPENFVERLAAVKNGTYTRTDANMRQVGVGAQSLQELLPEAVLDGEYLSVAYGNAALAACVELAKSVVALRAEIKSLQTK
jgi:hypothetical protein